MPDRAEFEKYFSKYMLVYEGIQNRGIAFSPLIKKLIEAKSSDELSKHIELICDMMDSYEKEYACVPDIKAGFPPMVMLGTVLYPADVFSDSIDYQKILKIFGTEEQGGDQNNYIELPMTFTIASVVRPSSFASRKAASESAVSPDWLITITRPFLSSSGFM